MENLKIISLFEIKNSKIYFGKILEKLMQMDYENIENLRKDDEGTFEQWYPIFLKNPETWRIMVNTKNEIIGYWHFVPLRIETYEKIKTGKIHEIELNENDIIELVKRGNYKIYFRSLVLKKEYRKSKATKKLIVSFFNVLKELEEKGIIIDEMCANAYTPQGKKWCEKLGMEYIGEISPNGSLYFLKLKNFNITEFLKDN